MVDLGMVEKFSVAERPGYIWYAECLACEVSGVGGIWVDECLECRELGILSAYGPILRILALNVVVLSI